MIIGIIVSCVILFIIIKSFSNFTTENKLKNIHKYNESLGYFDHSPTNYWQDGMARYRTGVYDCDGEYDENKSIFYQGKYKHGNYGYLGSNGKWVIVSIPPLFEEAGDFSEGLACVKLYNRWGFIDKSGKMVVTIPDGFYGSSSCRFVNGYSKIFSTTGYTSIIDRQGKIKVSINNIQHAFVFSGGFAAVSVGNILHNTIGLINKKGEIISWLSTQDKQCVWWSEGLFGVKIADKYGVINTSNQFVVDAKYDFIGEYSNGLAQAVLNHKSGYIDKMGNEVIALRYDGCTKFSEGYAFVVLDEHTYCIDKFGEIVFETESYLGYPYSDGFSIVVVRGKYGFIDNKGRIVINPIYEDALNFSEGLAFVKINKKWGCIDKTGKTIIAPFIDDASFGTGFSEGLAFVKHNNEYVFVDKTGEIVINVNEGLSDGFSEGLAPVTVDNKCYYINKNGKKIITDIWCSDKICCAIVRSYVK